MVRRIVATALGLTLTHAPLGALAAEPEPEGESEADPEEEDPVIAQVQALYVEGATKYSAADYAGAIEKFTEALGLLNTSDAEFSPEARGRLLYNLGTAHERRYKIDVDPVHLRTAIEIFGRIVDEAGVHGYGEELVEQSREARDRIVKQLEELEAEKKREEEAAAARNAPPPPPAEEDKGPRLRPGGGLMIAGGVVLGVGVASSGMLIAGLVIGRNAKDDLDAAVLPSTEAMRIDAIDRGNMGNNLAIAGGVLTGVLVVTGTALLVAGAVKRKKSRGAVACAPSFSPSGVYFGCGVRL